MRLKCKQAMQIFLTIGMLDEETPEQESETFKEGEIISVEVISETEEEFSEVQFGDGSMSYHLKKQDFEIL